jgi:2'-5' RNA ligase
MKAKVVKLNKKFGFTEIASHLPQHISLKISFECENHVEVMNDLEKEVLSKYSNFNVKTKLMEVNPGIIWILYDKNEMLEKLHNDIVEFLESKYKIVPHEFDKNFIFHTTLIHDETASISKLRELKDQLEKSFEPKVLNVSEIIFGASEDNQPKTFKTIKEISLNK